MSGTSKQCNTIVNVRNIGENFTNADLEEMFSRYGIVTSYKIIPSKDPEIGRFAYVAFEDPDAAEEAIIELNCQLISENQRIYLRRTHAKHVNHPILRKKVIRERNARFARLERNTYDKYTEIFVKNLVPTIDSDELHEIFKDCGEIRSSKVATKDGVSRGYGYIVFATTEEANNAVEIMNGRSERGKKLHVSLAAHHNFDKSKPNPCEVYVNNLSRHVESGDLRLCFQHCGDILDCKIIENDGVSRGYGFVTFKTPEAAKKAVNEMNRGAVGDKIIHVSLSSSKNHGKNAEAAARIDAQAASTDGARSEIFVKNLEPHINAEDLKLTFSNRDRITSARIIIENGRSKGYGFVTFRTPEDARRAVEETNGRLLAGKNLHVAIARGIDRTKNRMNPLIGLRSRLYESMDLDDIDRLAELMDEDIALREALDRYR